MNKFLVLLKKEIKELMTLEMILPLIAVAVIFMSIGNMVGKEQDKAKTNKQDIILIDQDKTETSDLVRQTLDKTLNIEELQNTTTDVALETAKKENKSLLLLIPSGFETSMMSSEPKQIEVYSVIKNFSMMGTKNYETISLSLSAINDALSNQLIAQNTNIDPSKLKNPMQSKDFVIVAGKQAPGNPIQIMSYITNQTTFIPIILFMVIILAAQMIATAIASEKENKTLETLLTAPIKRSYIVITKMSAAGIVALLSAGIYLVGLRSYVNGVSGGQLSSSGTLSETINQLGLAFTPTNYLLLGLALFFGILAALSIALILGAFAQDVKSVATLTTPLMILVMIPYFLTLFLDINSLSPALRYLVYAIPFTHSFLAAPNLLLHNYAPIIWGILYQLAFFVVFVMIATKIFSSDKIMTMKLSFKKKRSILN